LRWSRRGVHEGFLQHQFPELEALLLRESFQIQLFPRYWGFGFRGRHPSQVVVSGSSAVFRSAHNRHYKDYNSDTSLKNFLFTLNNPHNVPARRFALKQEMKDWAIYCNSGAGPAWSGGITVHDNCNADRRSLTCGFGDKYINDTGLDAMTFFTGSPNSQVKEIEGFEIS
jgi:hypothetical protein